MSQRPCQETFTLMDLVSVHALSQRLSPIGKILRSLPEWLLKEADRWAELDDAYRKRINEHRRYPVPDPWQHLLDAPAVSPNTKEVFRAAQSWLPGLKRLLHIATGYASLNTDWLEEALRAQASGDSRRRDRAWLKLVKKFARSKAIQQDPELPAEAIPWIKQSQAQIRHRPRDQRGKAEGFDPIVEIPEIKKRYPIEFTLVVCWLCFPKGNWPGLMFWSNKAITKFVFARKGQGSLGCDYIKKIRQRLGLIPVSAKSPIVWDISIKRSRTGWLEITGQKRNGDAIFQGTAEIRL